MARELAVMFMRTDGRQGEGWEGAVQGRETFFFPFPAWEGGPGWVTWLLNISRAHGKFLPQAILIQVSKNQMCFLSSDLTRKTGF